ncbi:YceI family protein [Polynucleobacter necessarius]|uniref:YceI family protein n=1 Tax=Polynucleobacter necessarius TaxID=576610 RepID=UPI000E098AB1|nr:YceI family protein [Polynucleobacter necessarius]
MRIFCNRFSRTFLTLLAVLGSGYSHATEYSSIDVAKSKITFTSKLMGSKLAGSFGKFSGKVSFNPDEPEKAKANLIIDINSFAAGGEELQEEAKGKDWFNAKNYPTANFVADSVKSTGSNALEIKGSLAIKGKTAPVAILAKYQVQGKRVVFDATLQLMRLDYGLGAGNWADTSAVANEVPVTVHLVLNQK